LIQRRAATESRPEMTAMNSEVVEERKSSQ
jgi:hypothetical protein